MSSISVVTATLQDIPQILEIVNHYIANDSCIYDIDPRTIEKQIEWFENQMIQQYPVIVAKQDDQVLGFASYSQYRPKVGYRFSMEHSIYLHPAFGQKGIGTLLMTSLISIAKEKNIHILIGGIDASNLGSIQFHEKFGFQIVGRMNEVGFKFNRWLDLIWMQKTL